MPVHDEIVAALRSLSDDIQNRHSENVTRQKVTELKVDEAIRRIDDLHKGFPGGDWDGHRRYHEAVVQKLEERAKFYQDLRTDLAQKGLWAIIVGLFMIIGFFIKAKIFP